MSKIERTVEGHYSTGSLLDRLREAAKKVGIDWGALTPADMAQIDHFHMRGLDATRELISLSGFSTGMTVLDVGCGIGGPARTLAAEVGCHVHGIDLTEEFIEVAREITARTGQGDTVKFGSCSALQLPFAEASFDGAWMQHVSMNIPEKGTLLREIARVVKPGGAFAFHEVLADQTDEPYFPVPWAASAEGSALATEDGLKGHLADAGFAVSDWHDLTRDTAGWFEAMFAKATAGEASRLDLSVLMGDRFPEMARNLHRSLVEGRIKVVMAVCMRG
ncbi:MAG: class I SAM-dependent methyltransferase [Armatimonadetes bacterium]|nr:class I SAM-dependent methyltransferase [Armatimonadota bacterium]